MKLPDAGRRRVMLLFGGRSAEHDVSRVTAVAVAKALDPDRYEVVPVGITTDGRWLAGGEAATLMAAGSGRAARRVPRRRRRARFARRARGELGSERPRTSTS